MSELELLQRRFDRERAARKEAESLLEEKSREVFVANQSLQELAERTRSIVETAAEGILTYDEHGQIDAINRSARKIFIVENCEDLRVQQLLQSPDLEVVLFPGSELDDDGEGQTTVPIEVTGIRMSGQTFVAEAAVSSTQSGDARIYTALVRDLSRRKQLEGQLRQAKKMESVGQMAAGIAHEINTPIQFISNNIQFLEGAFADLGELLDLFQKLTEALRAGAETDTLLKEIDTQSELADLPFLREEFPGAINQSLEGIERVATIVRAMKQFSQASSDAKEAVDINHVVENTLAVSASLYLDVAEVSTSLDQSIPPVSVIEGKLNQTIMNLIANAAEAIAERNLDAKGMIHVTTERLGDCFQVRVCDNGVGIPPDIQDRIFDPFFTTKEVGKGTGQGLSFVYDVVVNKHEGTVQVNSSSEGGTTVLMTFPMSSSETTSSERLEHARTIG